MNLLTRLEGKFYPRPSNIKEIESTVHCANSNINEIKIKFTVQDIYKTIVPCTCPAIEFDPMFSFFRHRNVADEDVFYKIDLNLLIFSMLSLKKK